MGIADIAAARPGDTLKGPPCAVCLTLASLDPIEAVALRGLLADTSWRYQELSDQLLLQDVDLPAFTLSRHARGRCSAREKLR